MRKGTRQTEKPSQLLSVKLSIPSRYRNWPLAYLPVSFRLERVLKNAGRHLLGDLDGTELATLIRLPDCGVGSLRELKRLVERVAAGEFDRLAGPGGRELLIDFLDESIQQLDSRQRDILLLRLGAADKEPATMEQAGAPYNLTSAGVIMILRGVFERLRRRGGPPLRAILAEISEECRKQASPLTPGLLQGWLGQPDARSSLKHGVEFYTRLLAELEPQIPVSPEQNQSRAAPGKGRHHEPPLWSVKLSIPNRYSSWPVTNLPVSVRLEGVLQKAGYSLLGDLDGIELRTLLPLRNCGTRSLRELKRLVERVVAGEFDRLAGPASKRWPALIAFLDESIEQLDTRDRDNLLKRLGAADEEPATLSRAGEPHNLTRECVRQRLKVIFERLRRQGGPPLLAMLAEIAEDCGRRHSPLTQELLQQSVRQQSNDRGLKFGVRFYTRLLGELEPRIQLPLGGWGSWTAKQKLIKETSSLLREHGVPMPLNNLLDALRADPDYTCLTAEEFLDAIEGSTPVQAYLPGSGERLVKYHSPSMRRRWVYEVLARSDSAMTASELAQRGRELYGEDFPLINVEAFTRFPEFLLLGPHRVGLVKHIGIPQGCWARIKTDCRGLLSREGRVFSALEIVHRKYFSWCAQTNAYELAAILCADDQFQSLRRMRFGLKGWGACQFSSLSQAVQEVLARAGRPLSSYDIRKEIQRRRRLKYHSISAFLAAQPNIVYYGHGYYGLHSLRRGARGELVKDAQYVNRVLTSLREPLTFQQFCEAVEVSPQGPLATLLLKTLHSLPLAKIEQDGDRLVLYHRNWDKRAATQARNRRRRERRQALRPPE